MYTLGKLKTFRGMETNGFNATLYRDGKLVADIIDEGCGGTFLYTWADHAAPKVEAINRLYDEKLFHFQATPEQAAFYKHVFELEKAPADELFPNGHYLDCDEVIARLFDEADFERRCRTKTKILYLDGGQVFEQRFDKSITMDAAWANVLKRYPTAKKLNGLNGSELRELKVFG